jgi:hypothetical protein
MLPAARRICPMLPLLYTNHSSLNCYFLADSESSRSSDPDSDYGVGGAAGVGGDKPLNQREVSIHNSPSRDFPGHCDDKQADEEAEDRHDHLTDDVPDMSDDDPGLIQKAYSIKCPATFQNLTASLRGGVRMISSKFTLPDGLPQCLVLEIFCTVPELAGQILGKPESGRLQK